MKTYYVYILSNLNSKLYVGMTNDLERRVYEHKTKLVDGHTKKYDLTRLVYFEETNDVDVAIAREKQIKGWLRKKKLDLIREQNPTFEDLSVDWFDQE